MVFLTCAKKKLLDTQIYPTTWTRKVKKSENEKKTKNIHGGWGTYTKYLQFWNSDILESIFNSRYLTVRERDMYCLDCEM